MLSFLFHMLIFGSTLVGDHSGVTSRERSASISSNASNFSLPFLRNVGSQPQTPQRRGHDYTSLDASAANPFFAVPFTPTLPSVVMGSPSIRGGRSLVSVAMNTAGSLSSSSHDTSMGRTHSVSPAGSREHSRVRPDPAFDIALFRSVENSVVDTVSAASEADRMAAVADLVYERMVREGFVLPSSAVNSASFVNTTPATAPSPFNNLQGSSPPSDLALLLAAVNRGTQATENLTRLILQRLGDVPHAPPSQESGQGAGQGGDAMNM